EKEPPRARRQVVHSVTGIDAMTMEVVAPIALDTFAIGVAFHGDGQLRSGDLDPLLITERYTSQQQAVKYSQHVRAGARIQHATLSTDFVLLAWYRLQEFCKNRSRGIRKTVAAQHQQPRDFLMVVDVPEIKAVSLRGIFGQRR